MSKKDLIFRVVSIIIILIVAVIAFFPSIKRVLGGQTIYFYGLLVLVLICLIGLILSIVYLFKNKRRNKKRGKVFAIIVIVIFVIIVINLLTFILYKNPLYILYNVYVKITCEQEDTFCYSAWGSDRHRICQCNECTGGKSCFEGVCINNKCVVEKKKAKEDDFWSKPIYDESDRIN